MWPEQPQNTNIDDALTESKTQRNLQMKLSESKNKSLIESDILHKCICQTLIIIKAYMMQFIHNCQPMKKRKKISYLKTSNKAELLQIKVPQQSTTENTSNLELMKQEDGILECSGQAPNCHPIYILEKQKLPTPVMKYFHKKSLHSGVSVTMSNICERF